MNEARPDREMAAALQPLATLLVAYAPREDRAWHRLSWLLDQRLAEVVRRGGEPTIAAIRLAWWDEVLVEGDLAKGRGEPLVEAWRAMVPGHVAPFTADLIDGWRMLLGSESLSMEELAAYGRKRGGGLFGLLGGSGNEAVAEAANLWAQWDLAGHVSDAELAGAALALARDAANHSAVPRDRRLKPLRLLHHVARADALAGHVPRGFEARHYRALLWRSLLP